MDLTTILAALSMGGGMAQGAPTPAGAMPQTLLPGATGVAPQGIFGATCIFSQNSSEENH